MDAINKDEIVTGENVIIKDKIIRRRAHQDLMACRLLDGGGDVQGTVQEADHHTARGQRWWSGWGSRGGCGGRADGALCARQGQAQEAKRWSNWRKDTENKMRFLKIEEDEQKLGFIRSCAGAELTEFWEKEVRVRQRWRGEQGWRLGCSIPNT